LNRTIADEALVEPQPGVDPLSTTVTAQPRRLSSRAIDVPMMPAPTTTAVLDEDAEELVTTTPTEWIQGQNAQ
jgi:hypothetical protein